ncbi:hypothetical protein EVAR_14229_1, partial [Eumeta japonica]
QTTDDYWLILSTEKYPAIKQLFGHDPLLKWVVTGLVLVQLLTLPAVVGLSWPAIVILAYCFGGVINHSLLAAIHEIAHNLAFGHGRPLHNRLLGFFANLPLGIPLSISFKKYHLEHHRYQGDEVPDIDLPTLIEARMFCTTGGKLLWLALQPLMLVLRPLLVRPQPATSLEIVNLVIQLLFDAVIVKLFGWTALAYLVLGTLMSTGLHPIAVLLNTEDEQGRLRHPKSYPPIGLLPVLGKTVERMLCVVAGFGNPVARSKFPSKHPWHVLGYLRDREVVVRYAGGERRKRNSKGCIQGSITGPSFWNLILDSLLRELGELGVYLQVFADDVVLVFSEQSASSIKEEANRALARVHCWEVINKLRFTSSKTNSMLLTKKLKYDDPVVHMNGEQISLLVGQIRLLDLTIDRKLKFIPHVAKACKKTVNIYKGLAQAAKAKWGLSPEVTRTVYVVMIEPKVLYASCVWAPATRKLGVRKMLNAVQRSVALKACGAHRTVSLHSALIPSMLLPLDIRVREAV